MTTLEDLKTQFHLLSFDEQLKIVMEIRALRRIPKKSFKVKSTAVKTKNTAGSTTKSAASLIDSMSSAQKLSLLKLLTGDLNE